MLREKILKNENERLNALLEQKNSEIKKKEHKIALEYCKRECDRYKYDRQKAQLVLKRIELL